MTSQAPAVALSVIVPMRNAQATIGATLSSLLAQTLSEPWELVIIDNGSRDRSAELAAEAISGRRPPSLRQAQIGSYPQRRGHASPRNHGVELSLGRHLAFCDADDEVAPTWAHELLAALEHHPFVASRHVIMESGGRDDGAAELPVKFGVPVAYTGGMACTRALFDAVGGFDPAFDRGGEDSDLSMRIRKEFGVRPMLAAKALYLVRPRSAAGATFRQAYRNARSGVRLLHAHADIASEPRHGASVLPRRLASVARRFVRPGPEDSLRSTLWMLGWTLGRAVESVRLRERYF